LGGLTVLITGAGILASAGVEALYGGAEVAPLALAGAALSAVGGTVWRLTCIPVRIRRVDVFIVVTTSWLLLIAAGALPYLVTGTLERVDDALFESVSGFTTTGATVLRPIEDAPVGVLFWRSLSQWLGGMGVIVLVVAVLPSVGAGGMDLLQAEAPGPTGERLTPRLRQTARYLWSVYLGLTALLGVGYLAAGMSPFDAVAHSFTTVSTGGFSPHTASIGHFDSAVIEWVAVAGMILAGGTFSLYYRALTGRAGPLLRSAELRLYLVVLAGTSLFLYLEGAPERGLGHDAARQAAFTVASVVSTTGYTVTDFAQWSPVATVVLLLLMPVGAMAGSTAGGVKLVRILAVGSFAYRELVRQLHPRLVRPVRAGAAPIDEAVASRVLGFLVLALVVFGCGVVTVAATGADLTTSFSASATAFGNVGPGLGDIGPASDFRALEAPARAAMAVVMLLGRLEIYPILLSLAALPALTARLRRRGGARRPRRRRGAPAAPGRPGLR
jgi:trk system potassium uptake protein TrkH